MNKLLIFSCFIIHILTTHTAAFADDSDRWNPALTWYEVPWKIRYLLFIDTASSKAKGLKVAKRINAADGQSGKDLVYLIADELLGKSKLIATPGGPAIGTNLLVFDKQGDVLNDETTLRGYAGKMSALEHLVLIHKERPEAKPYDLLYWSQGVPGDTSFGPSPCTLLDKFRYQDGWKSGKYPGDFGCREWTAQLFNAERPYIDVTTYTPRGNFIGRFVGWSRFEDKPKPVIGMNGKTWLCLHECPSGETPGVINDIKAWTSKHGYAMPVPPAFQPEYPDKNYDEAYCEAKQEGSLLMAYGSHSLLARNAGVASPYEMSDSPWEVHYLLFVDTAAGRTEELRLAKRYNDADKSNKRNLVYLMADELLGKAQVFVTPRAPSIGTNLLAFDQQGNVLNKEPSLLGYVGRRSSLAHLVLIHKDKPNAKPYDLLFWMPGLPDEPYSTPSPCTMLDKFRYEDSWKSGKYPGDFGCREWTAQLLNNERPYIDVTTYTRHGNFIGRFVGWSRFEDGPKPVIGMNGKTWLCLHECPSGETPGVIKDIKAWTSKHGYAMPVPPAFQPEYPDRNYDQEFCAVYE